MPLCDVSFQVIVHSNFALSVEQQLGMLDQPSTIVPIFVVTRGVVTFVLAQLA